MHDFKAMGQTLVDVQWSLNGDNPSLEMLRDNLLKLVPVVHELLYIAKEHEESLAKLGTVPAGN